MHFFSRLRKPPVISGLLPGLPLEVHGHILSFCDVQTLGRSSRVSLAFLELSGPLLYRDITITTWDQFQKLDRADAVFPSLAPFLSFAQTRSLTWLPSYTNDFRTISEPAFCRMLNNPLKFENVVIDLRQHSFTRFSEQDLHDVLPAIKPQHLHILTPLAHCSSTDRDWPIVFYPGYKWSELCKLTFSNTGEACFFENRLWPGSLQRPIDLVFDMSSVDQGWDQAQQREFVLERTLSAVHRTLCDATYGNVQVWVDDEKEIQTAKTILGDCSWVSLDIGVKQLA